MITLQISTTSHKLRKYWKNKKHVLKKCILKTNQPLCILEMPCTLSFLLLNYQIFLYILLFKIVTNFWLFFLFKLQKIFLPGIEHLRWANIPGQKLLPMRGCWNIFGPTHSPNSDQITKQFFFFWRVSWSGWEFFFHPPHTAFSTLNKVNDSLFAQINVHLYIRK